MFVALTFFASSCSSEDSFIRKEFYLDATSFNFPAQSDGSLLQELKVFYGYEQFNDYLLTFDDMIVGEDFESQLSEIEQEFNRYDNAGIFLVEGTFGTSDVLNFKYSENEFICNIYTPNPSTEGLTNLFVAVIIEWRNERPSSSIDFIVNRNL